MDTMTIFWIGATAIILLIMVIFVDKKNHTELMIEIEESNNKIKIETMERAKRVRTKTNDILKSEKVKS